MSDTAYTPRAEYRCTESSTHYQGCACHEQGWNNRLEMERKEVQQLRFDSAKLRELLRRSREWIEKHHEMPGYSELILRLREVEETPSPKTSGGNDA
jgi:hypothetical protein